MLVPRLVTLHFISDGGAWSVACNESRFCYFAMGQLDSGIKAIHWTSFLCLTEHNKMQQLTVNSVGKAGVAQ